MTPFASWRVRVLLGSTLLVLLFAALTYVDPLQQGLNSRYFLTADARAVPLRTGIDAPPFTARLALAWPSPMPQAFNATWEGGLLAATEGRYTFGTMSDDGSRVFVDGALVVDNGGAHGPELKTGSVTLTRGVHALFVEYNQQGGGYQFDLLWARGDAALTPVPASVLATRRTSLGRFRASAIVWSGLAAAEWLWFAVTGAVLCSFLAGPLQRLKRSLTQQGSWPAMGWILAISVILNAAGIWWGLPGGWPPGELSPKAVLDGMGRHFSSGWFDTYPPLHFYILAAAISPALWLDALGRLDLSGGAGYTRLALLTRAVSVVGGAVTVVAVCMAGTRAFGVRAGLLGAAVFALATPFVYYAKTANVDAPYLMWFAISVVYYLRVLDHLRPRDFIVFGITATLAVCTKDQAYGLYLLMPLPIVQRLWESNREARAPWPLVRAVIDRRLLAAGAAAAALFAVAHNLVFNASGFRDHVQYLVGPGSADYQVYDATLAGRWQLLALTFRLIQESLGWPFFVAAMVGVVMALVRPSRRVAVWLLVPAVSYYLSFINVILYNYDRFVLPLCLLLAPFAGSALDRLLAWRVTPARLRHALVALAFLYTLTYTATLDVLMIGDARYAAEDWLAAHVGKQQLVGSTFAAEYLPRLDPFRHEEIRSVEGLTEKRPEFYVLNADYGRTVGPESPTFALITGLRSGALGYQRVFSFRRASPWPWLPGGHHDLVGARLETRVATVVRNINPTIEIFQRRQ